MLNTNHILGHLQINPRYLAILESEYYRLRFKTVVRILVVTDTEISTHPGPNFGVGTVVELIQNSTVGCMSFSVDIALRSAAPPSVNTNLAPFSAKYDGFRFDMMNGGAAVIDGYDQIWIFGFKPGNDAGPDSHIDLPSSLPASDSELAKLSTWMNAHKGGIFATGDHDYLGASLCHRIPRIGTMRRWTNADGVPPIGGFGEPDTADRIDTLRPPSAAYEPGAPGGPLAMGNDAQQGDLMPQPIAWVPWQSLRTGIFTFKNRPHPVLCHPTLGPIDVMPDHAHEGLCRDTGTILLTGTYNFDGSGAKDEYPPSSSGGAQPAPTVIAYGSTLGDPPYNFVKGPQPARSRFPMISVYDGHLADVGRVATDSTWHHWFGLNIEAMKTENGEHWAKVSRYYINLAVWLAPPGFSTRCLWWCILLSHFTATGFQEYSTKLNDVALGQSAIAQLWRIYGPCWVTHTVFDLLRLLDYRLLEKPHLPIPPECLTCPPFELLELAVLGGLVRATLPIAADINLAVTNGASSLDGPTFSVEDSTHQGVHSGIRSVVDEWRESMKRSETMLARLQQ